MNSRTRRTEERWRQGLADELEFWEAYLSSGGLDWRDEFAHRIDPSAPLLESEIIQRLGDVRSSSIRILDVGAGPLTCLGKRLPDRGLDIVPIDALAREYATILSKHGIVPPIPTRLCAAEDIAATFRSNSFDFAYARNALDHVRQPIRAIRGMLAVTKPNGWVILRHRPNEGAGASYQGLHQWNFDERDGRVVVWNESQSHFIQRALRWRGVVTARRDGEWIVCTIRKLPYQQWLQRLYTLMRRKQSEEIRSLVERLRRAREGVRGTPRSPV
jgi:SAM-dependent methyltransferase